MVFIEPAPGGAGNEALVKEINDDLAGILNSAAFPLAFNGVAWGDAWTNLLQPFWALPMLGIAGLKARDIMGYCVVMLLVTGVVIGAGLLFL